MTFLAGREKDTERDVRTAAGPIHFVTGCLDVLATKDLCIPMVNVEWCNLVIARGGVISLGKTESEWTAGGTCLARARACR